MVSRSKKDPDSKCLKCPKSLTHLSLFGVCMEFCPFGKGWWGIWGETLEAVYEVVLELLVLRSRPSCLMGSSAFCTPATSFHSCCRSVGHMAVKERERECSGWTWKWSKIASTCIKLNQRWSKIRKTGLWRKRGLQVGILSFIKHKYKIKQYKSVLQRCIFSIELLE